MKKSSAIGVHATRTSPLHLLKITDEVGLRISLANNEFTLEWILKCDWLVCSNIITLENFTGRVLAI